MAKIQDIVAQRSGEIRGAYENMLLGMQGAWMGFAANLGNAQVARLQLHTQLSGLVQSFGGLMRPRARDAVIAAHAQGVTDAQGAVALVDAPAPMIEEAQSALDAAAARDGRGMLLLAHQTALRYNMARQSMPHDVARAAALGELPGQGRDVFVQLDRLQRKRSSADFISASLRMAMYATYFNGFTSALATSGSSKFEAVHPEAAAVPLDLMDGWTAWAAENTHPNTRWSLRRMEST
jgi:hypothetical protein